MSLKKLGRYDLIRVLGKGAMGVVYEGRDPNLDRRVAIKTVTVENLSEEAEAEYEARFRTEARSAARLQHPNIVSVYDSDRDIDIAYLVMEYIQGEDLKHYLDRGVRYSLEQALKMIRDLLSALDYAHKQGIVHRDVKPANLLIEPDGRVKLTDFGVARIQDSGEITRTQGSMVGTLKYMSPEQVQGQKIDSRADLFSVGVVLYQLLTDRRPFDGDNDFSIIHQIMGHTPAPPSSINPRLPSALDAVVARALAKDREQRFATARDFATALQSAVRRAEDQTVMPPADPARKLEPASTGSKAVPSVPGAGIANASTVNQEVELVYWKDIKDSTDPEELEGFLDRFPAGIYADLARRRLRKLSGVNSSPDQTILSTGTLPGTLQDLDATLAPTGTRPPVLAAPAASNLPQAQAADAESVAAPAGGRAAAADMPLLPVESTVRADGAADQSPGERAILAAAQTPAQVAVLTQDQLAELPDHTEDVTLRIIQPRPTPAGHEPDGGMARPDRAVAKSRPTPPAAVPTVSRRLPLALLAGLAAVGVVAIAAFLMTGRGGPQKTIAAPAGAASSPAPEVRGEPPVTLTTVTAPPAAAAASAASVVSADSADSADSAASPGQPAAAASVPRARASAARRLASAATAPKPTASTPPVEIVRAAPPPAPAPVPAPVPVREQPRPVPAAAAAAAANPVEACKDKFFLTREFCLAEHCDKPGLRSHPLCVARREEAKLREESRIQN